MGAYSDDDGAGPHEGIGRFGGVVVVYTAVGGIPAVKGVTGSGIGAVGYGLVYLPVNDRSKRAVLVDNARKGVGEGRVLDTVEYHSSYGYLPRVWLTAGFGGDYPG